jgi:hypothetical protein
MKLRRWIMSSAARQKRLTGLTMASVATIVAWGMVGQGTALGQTTDQETTFRSTALSATNADRANFSNPPCTPVPPATTCTPPTGSGPLTLAAATDSLNTGAEAWAR